MLKMQIFTSSTVHKQTQSPNSILAKSCEKPERLHNVRAQIEKKIYISSKAYVKLSHAVCNLHAKKLNHIPKILSFILICSIPNWKI